MTVGYSFTISRRDAPEACRNDAPRKRGRAKHDIATLSNDIVAGKLGVPSVANARHTRRAASGLFNWAPEAGRDYVTASPCVNLPKLDPEHPRTRVLSEEEIRIFWHGLDRDDLPSIAVAFTAIL
jgi:hypothetical protein